MKCKFNKSNKMNKLVIVLVAIFGVVFSVNAKDISGKATQLPVDFKQEIVKHINYPEAASKASVEGEVWMKVTLDENSKVDIIDLSATHPELGNHVKNELANKTINNTSFIKGNIYYMVVKFNLDS